jgi:hypothetical protein
MMLTEPLKLSYSQVEPMGVPMSQPRCRLFNFPMPTSSTLEFCLYRSRSLEYSSLFGLFHGYLTGFDSYWQLLDFILWLFEQAPRHQIRISEVRRLGRHLSCEYPN